MYYFLEPCEKCTCSPGQEAESSAESFSAIPASVLSRLNLTAAPSCSKDSATASCQSSQYGMMCEPSTASPGADSLTACAAGSHAKTSAQRGGGRRKQRGIEGPKSGLWREMRRVVCEVRPSYVFFENSPAITFRGLERVLCDLAALGYDVRWGMFSAADVGARHERHRLWGFAHWNAAENSAWKKPCLYDRSHTEPLRIMSGWISAKPEMGRIADGLAGWMDELAAIGNGQVPSVVALAWKTLSGESNENPE